MKIITGTAKGKPLKTLSGDSTRPTSAAIKEAMFSVIQFELENSVVLDLFAGSGQLGIEALSRGAKRAFFCDESAKAVSIIKQNLEYTKLFEKAYISKLPCRAFLRFAEKSGFEPFDVVFIDPPYNKGIIAEVLPLLFPRMSVNGVIICEHENRLNLPETVNFFESKRYSRGSTAVTIYRRKAANINEKSEY